MKANRLQTGDDLLTNVFRWRSPIKYFLAAPGIRALDNDSVSVTLDTKTGEAHYQILCADARIGLSTQSIVGLN